MTALSLIAISVLIFNPRRFFYGKWNIGKTTYKPMRSFLLISYWLCWGAFVVGSKLSDNFVIRDWEAKGIVMSPGFAIFSTIFVTVILLLDANYRASRKLGFEKNFLKHTLMGWSFVPAFVVCAFMNKPLIALLAVVTVAGWFMPLKRSEV
jgi:hypothetical protein